MPPIYRNKLSCVCNATLGSARLTLPLYNPFSLHSPLRFLSHPPSSQPLHSIPLPETNFVFEARHCSHRRHHHHHHRVQISAAVFLLLLSQTIVALQLPLARSLARSLPASSSSEAASAVRRTRRPPRLSDRPEQRSGGGDQKGGGGEGGGNRELFPLFA